MPSYIVYLILFWNDHLAGIQTFQPVFSEHGSYVLTRFKLAVMIYLVCLLRSSKINSCKH